MNEEIKKFQEIIWSLEILDQLTDAPEIRDAVITDLHDQH